MGALIVERVGGAGIEGNRIQCSGALCDFETGFDVGSGGSHLNGQTESYSNVGAMERRNDEKVEESRGCLERLQAGRLHGGVSERGLEGGPCPSSYRRDTRVQTRTPSESRTRL